MAGGFGAQRFGSGPFGTSDTGGSDVVETVTISEALQVSVPFKVVAAASLSKTLVELDFSGLVDPAHATNFDPANYSISGLTILDVDPSGSNGKSVVLRTSTQLAQLYTVVVDSTPGLIQGVGGDQLDSLHASAQFQGDGHPATFACTAQSSRKLRLNFSESMLVDSQFRDPANFLLTTLDGTGVAVDAIQQIGTETTKAEVLLAEELVPFELYSLQVNARVKTATGAVIYPDQALVQWKEVVPRPIRMAFGGFSGEVTAGLLGAPAGQVFFSPAFGTSVPNSVIQLESVSVCTRAYDVYTVPSLPDPPVLFTYPAPIAGTDRIGAAGAVLFARAFRLGLATMALSDHREETLPRPAEGLVTGLLVEPIDITRASFLNDARWRSFPGTGASLGAFRTADNLTSIGPGATIGPFSIP